MALLNPPGILPTAMWAVTRLIADGRPMNIKQAEALLSPTPLRGGGDGTDVKETVRALREIGLLRPERDGILQLTRPLAPAAADDFAAFAAELRAAALAPDLNTGIGDNDEQRGPRDLTRALVWFLTLDPLGEPLAHPDVERRQKGALPKQVGLPFRNNTRWNSFTYWGPALGLVNQPLLATGGPRRLIPDPTGAVRQIVLSLWRAGDRPGVRSFVERLLGELPVLPGGAYARALGVVHDPERLDSATSFALLCGHHQKWIRLEYAADAADSLLVVDPDAPGRTRVVTDITILGAANV
jgi:hypothetical protein